MIVENFEQLLTVLRDKKLYIYQSDNTTSLHFTITAVQSEMCSQSPNKLVLGYTRTMMGFLLFNPEPSRIGMIGLGGGSLPKYCYAYLPNASIVVAENNPEVIALRESFFIPENNSRFNVVCADGADFVKENPLQFDVLIIDGFEDHGQPRQLCTQEFYRDCYSSLAPDGVMVVNFLDCESKNIAFIERIYDSFDGKIVVINALESSNKIVFGFKGNTRFVSDDDLLSRLKSLVQHHPVGLTKTARDIVLKRRIHAPVTER